MQIYYRKQKILGLLGASIIVLNGCSSQIEAPRFSHSENLNSQTVAPAQNGNVIQPGPSNQDLAKIDMAKESEIEKSCLEAWRKSLAGKSQAAITQLKALAQRYPDSSSVMFMTGQVLERSGDRKEAIKYYQGALHDSDFAVMSLFKLAESLRTTGDTRQAIVRYHELIKIAPQFVQAHLGLAKALQELPSASPEDKQEAKKELQIALKLEPNNEETKELLKKTN